MLDITATCMLDRFVTFNVRCCLWGFSQIIPGGVIPTYVVFTFRVSSDALGAISSILTYKILCTHCSSAFFITNAFLNLPAFLKGQEPWPRKRMGTYVEEAEPRVLRCRSNPSATYRILTDKHG